MFRLPLLIVTFVLLCVEFVAQSEQRLMDSIRQAYHIPELAYAVVSADSIYELQVIGLQKIHSQQKAQTTDRFRIGSNTKTVTSYLAALLVKEGKLRWDTRFFDLYPELKTQSHPAYSTLTLKDLITFRAPLLKWTYTDNEPKENEIKGTAYEQRYQFMAWVLKQPPVTSVQTVYWSNPAYVAAGMMLEKASGKTYEDLIEKLNTSLRVHFTFGAPNEKDPNQPWGHDEALNPEQPASNPKLNWLSSAGNLQVSLPDYISFIQVQLKGLAGQLAPFSQEEFEEFHFGLPEFAYGWKCMKEGDKPLIYSYHEGNPGSFLSKVFICKNTGLAFILFCNVQSTAAEAGLNQIGQSLRLRYAH